MGVSALNRRLKYRPPLLKARGGPPPADPYHPPGSHLISKKSNFSGTYTISEGSDLGHLSGTFPIVTPHAGNNSIMFRCSRKESEQK